MKNTALTFGLVLCFFSLRAQTFLATDYGAVADGTTLNTVALQAAIDACNASGGGEVLLTGGEFMTGTIYLKSNVALRIDAGAKLLGSTAVADYPDTTPQLPTYVNNYSRKSLIYAEGQENVSLVGAGTLDGRGTSFLGANERPFGFRFISCSNVLVEGLNLRNSGFWMMHNFDIDSLVIRNVNINNLGNSNNDGLSVDGCRNVLIENCTVDCNDDPLVLKTTGPANCENVEVRNCTLATWARAIKIGSETHAGFKNIHLHDLTVVWSSLSFPPFVGVGSCGINLAIVDGGSMENVVVENVQMEGVKTAIMVRLGDRGRVWEDGLPAPAVGYVKDVIIRNVNATVESNVTSTITGIPGFYAKNILLEDITVNFPGGASDPGAGFVVPENESSKPDNDIFGSTLPSYGLYVRHVDSLALNNVCFTWHNADARPGIMLDDVINTPTYSTASTSAGGCIQLSSGIETRERRKELWVDMHSVLHYPSSGTRTTLEVFNAAGQKVLFRTNVAVEEDLSVLHSGIYVGMLRDGRSESSVRFIVR